MKKVLRTSAFVLVVTMTPACSPRAVEACSQIGGIDGVTVRVMPAPFTASGSIRVKVCDGAGCASTSQDFGPIGGEPTGFGATFTFADLGRTFEPGPSSLMVLLSDSEGVVLAKAHREIQFERTYSNGSECDGEGFVSAQVGLGAQNRADGGEKW